MRVYGKWRAVRMGGYGLLMACAVLAGTYIAMGTVRAETPKTSLAISPPVFELSANPGDTLTHSIRVDNLTDSAMPLEVARKDFVAMGEEGQAMLTDEPTQYSLSSWIHPQTSEFSLPARDSKMVKFTIRVPKNAEPGGHFGSVVFKTAREKRAEGSGLATGQEIGALVLLRVAGEVNEAGRIASFRPQNSIVEAAPVTFETRFKNTGNVQTRISGKITISDMFGRKISDAHLERNTVLPGSVRKTTTEWQGGVWPGWYTATVSLGYGTKGQLITASTSFLIFPYKIILPIITVLTVLGVLAYRGRRRLGRAAKILFGKE